jgi:hypothetical protein
MVGGSGVSAVSAIPPRYVGVGGESRGFHRLACSPGRKAELTRWHEDLDPAPVGGDLQAGRGQQPTQPEADLEIVSASGVESAVRLVQ